MSILLSNSHFNQRIIYYFIYIKKHIYLLEIYVPYMVTNVTSSVRFR